MTDALAVWSAAALLTVELPSGFEVRIRIPSVQTMIRRGLMPSDLRQVALRFASTGIDPSQIGEEEMTKLLEFSETVLGLMVKEVRIGPDAEWQPVTLSTDMLDELPSLDVEALRAIANRQATPTQITARSRRQKGLLTPVQVQAIEEEEGDATLGKWEPFRGQRPGAPPSDPVPAVGPTAVGGTGGQRADDRAGD